MRNALISILLFVSVLVSGQVTRGYSFQVTPSSSISLPSNCIAYYKFESKTDDEQGTYDGTLVGNAAYDGDSMECGSYSVYLDGDGDAFDCSAVNTTDDFAIAMWVNLEDISQSQYIIGNKASTGVYDGWSIKLNSADEKLQFYASDGTNYTYLDSETSGFEYDQWVFIVVTVSKTDDEVEFYVNNTDITPASNSISNYDFATSGNDLYIGALTNLVYESKGYFDEVMFFSRVLTSTEISDLYTNSCEY